MTTTWTPLSPQITSRVITVNDLDIHILEANPQPDAPLIILLHSFPELSYSWRKIIVPLSQAGYHVVAPDQRGYGRTHPHDSSKQVEFTDDLAPYRILNLVKDIISLVYVLGHQSVAAVVGHDYGSLIAGFCTLIRPDVFKSLVLMGTPFAGIPAPAPSSQAPTKGGGAAMGALMAQLATLDPPRKHYMPYFCSPDAGSDMHHPPGGLHAFLRAFFHMKSADWPHHDPHPLPRPDAAALASLPDYYVLPLHSTMPQAVAPHAPSVDEVAQNTWLTDDELAVYVTEYEREGFQGGLNWYRTLGAPQYTADLALFGGKRISKEIKVIFVAGEKDWGVWQNFGQVERMKELCEGMAEGDEGFVIVKGAGHWVQQEKPEEVLNILLKFLGKAVSFAI